MDWKDLEDRLAAAIGLDASSLGSNAFQRAVNRRMRAREIASMPAYSRLLDADAAEYQALIEELVVRESWFFRQVQAFDLLKRHALQTLAGRQSHYRVLSFPCAGGEEPYSIVMSLREAGLEFSQFDVDAADVSETALHKARIGRYGLRTIRSVPPAIQERYFRITPEAAEVRPEIREAVQFTRSNIVRGHELPPAPPYDAVFCRNLVIYLTPIARRGVMQSVYQWLSSSGLFFVGHAEILREFDDLFETVNDRGAFAYAPRRQPKVEQSAALLKAPPFSTGSFMKPVGQSKSALPIQQRAATVDPVESPGSMAIAKQRTPLEQPTIASRMSDKMQQGDILSMVSELSRDSRHAEAIETCAQQLRQDGPNPSGYYLLGMVLQAAGLHLDAVVALERAIYLDPDHEEALLALSLLARRHGDVLLADRYQQRSQRAYDRRGPQ